MGVKALLLFIGWMLASAACNPKKSLVADLFRDYDKRVEPFGPNTTLDVKMNLDLVEISDVDEQRQVLTTNCWLSLNWRDESLEWRPEKYGNVRDIRVPLDNIWRPDLKLKNSVEANQLSLGGLDNANVWSSGDVFVTYQVILKSSCQIDVTYFPMDQQACVMTFQLWTYNGDQLNISNVAQGEVVLYEYVPNAEWKMISYTNSRQVEHFPCCPEPYITLTYKVILKRRPLFFLMYLMMPCFLITLVALLGFLVPNESGETISIGITCLLAMIAMLPVISTLLPATSVAIPLIGWYYVINICIVSLSTGLAVLTLNIHHLGARGHKLPQLVKTLCFSFLARILFMKVDLSESTDEDMVKHPAHEMVMKAYQPVPTLADGQSGEGNNVVDVLNRLLHTVEMAMDLYNRKITTQDSLDKAAHEWKLLAIVLERALTIIFLIVTICTACIMFSESHW